MWRKCKAAILCVNVCIAIDPMLNFDGDANADIKREQAFRVDASIVKKKC